MQEPVFSIIVVIGFINTILAISNKNTHSAIGWFGFTLLAMVCGIG